MRRFSSSFSAVDLGLSQPVKRRGGVLGSLVGCSQLSYQHVDHLRSGIGRECNTVEIDLTLPIAELEKLKVKMIQNGGDA